MGRIFAADTIAVSSPAFTHSCRNTEFSTCRAAALSPNDTFEMPSVVCTPGVPALELADRLDRLQRVAADLLLPGGDREGEGVDDDVLDVHAVVRGQVADEPVRDPDLPLGGAGLALLVDAQRDDRRTVLADQRHRPLEARAGAVAVFVVHRVDDRPAAQALQPGAQHLRLGGVEHDRQRGRGGQPAGQLRHVGGAVAAHVVDVEVDQVRAVAGLLAGHRDAVVPALREHRLAERLATRWRWCARPTISTEVSWRNGTGA